MKNTEVYVVAESSIEGYEIKAICLHEKTARKEFYKLKRAMIKRVKEYLESSKSIGRTFATEIWTEELSELRKSRYPIGDGSTFPRVDKHVMADYRRKSFD